jgi:hypothetical protein
LLARRQVPPLADPQPGDRERADPGPAQPLDLDPGHVHDPPHEVKNTLVDRDGDDHAIGRLTQEPHLLRHDPPSFDHDTAPDPLQLLRVRPGSGQDLIFLGQPIARVHDAVRHVAVVREEQQSLSVAVEPADREDALLHVDQVHHGPAIALVLDGRDVAAWLVQDQVAQRLRTNDPLVDPNLIPLRISLGAKRGHDHAVDRNPALANQFFGCPARCDPARCEDALQAFHLDAS